MSSYSKTVDLSNDTQCQVILGRIEDILYAKYATASGLRISAKDDTLAYDSERGVFTCNVLTFSSRGEESLGYQEFPYKLFKDLV